MTVPSGHSRLRALRIPPEEQERLLSRLAHAGRAPYAGPDRRQTRVPFVGQTVIVVLTPPEGEATKYAVVPRNLGRGGLGFIHGQFIHPGRPCRVILPTLQQQWVSVEGAIRHCRHLEGIVHEIAIHFNQPIDLAQFVALSPAQAAQLQREQARARAGSAAPRPSSPALTLVAVPAPPSTPHPQAPAFSPQPLCGRVLLVDSLEVDRRLFDAWLQAHGLRTTLAANAAEALAELARAVPDLVLLDLHRGEQWGVDLLRQLRDAGFRGPLATLAADDSERTQAAAMAAGSDAVLAKPCARAGFSQMVEQLLAFDAALVAGSDAPIFSTSPADPAADDASTGDLDRFIAGLHRTIDDLTTAAQGRDLAALESLCDHLKGSAGGHGLAPIAQVSRLALGQIQQADPDPAAVQRAVEDVVAVVRRVRCR